MGGEGELSDFAPCIFPFVRYQDGPLGISHRMEEEFVCCKVLLLYVVPILSAKDTRRDSLLNSALAMAKSLGGSSIPAPSLLIGLHISKKLGRWIKPMVFG